MSLPDAGSVPDGARPHLGEPEPLPAGVADRIRRADALGWPGASPETLGLDLLRPAAEPRLGSPDELRQAVAAYYEAAEEDPACRPAVVVRLAAVLAAGGSHGEAADLLEVNAAGFTGRLRAVVMAHHLRARVLAGGYAVAHQGPVEEIAAWLEQTGDPDVTSGHVGLIRAFGLQEWVVMNIDAARVLLDVARRIAARVGHVRGELAVATDLAVLYHQIGAHGAFTALVEQHWENWARAAWAGGPDAPAVWENLVLLAVRLAELLQAERRPTPLSVLGSRLAALLAEPPEDTASDAERAARGQMEQLRARIALFIPVVTAQLQEELGRDGAATRNVDAAIELAAAVPGDPEPLLTVLDLAGRATELAARLDALPPELDRGDVVARFWTTAGRPREAAAAIERAGTTVLPPGTPFTGPYALRSVVARLLGRRTEALRAAGEAVARVERWLSLMPHDSWRISVLDGTESRQAHHAAVLAAETPADVLAAADRSRAHALGRLVAERLDGGPPAPEVRRVRAAAASWNGAFDRLGAAHRRTGVEDASASLAAAELELDTALSAAPPRDLRPLPSLDPAAVAAALDPDTVLLHVTATDEGLVLVIRTRDRETVVRRSITRRRLFGVAARVRQSWHDDWSAEPADLAVLADALLDPVRAHLSACRRLLVIPDGPLAVLPFAALELDGKTLVTEWSVSQLPAAALVPRLAGRSTLATGGGALVVGDPPSSLRPLPAARVEALHVARMLRTTALVGEAAAEPAVQERMPGASRLVHLATHGVLDEEAPDLSHLVLAHDESFTVADVLGVGLDTDLVVLSACDSGRGEITQGGDVVGLARGMLAAGARHTVASTWPVPDRTSCLLMIEFVRLLTDGGSVADSLAAAQRAVRGWSFDERTERYLALAAEVGEPADPPSRRDQDRLRGTGPLLDLSGPGPTHPRWWGGFVHLGM